MRLTLHNFLNSTRLYGHHRNKSIENIFITTCCTTVLSRDKHLIMLFFLIFSLYKSSTWRLVCRWATWYWHFILASWFIESEISLWSGSSRVCEKSRRNEIHDDKKACWKCISPSGCYCDVYFCDCSYGCYSMDVYVNGNSVINLYVNEHLKKKSMSNFCDIVSLTIHTYKK